MKNNCKIAYYLHWNDNLESGVFKKVLGQTNFWMTKGYKVKIFMLSRSSAYSEQNNTKETIFVEKYHNIISRLDSLRKIAKAITEWAPDMIYYRYDLFYPPLYPIIKKFPTVVEINSDDLSEYRTGSKHRYFYNYLTRDKLFRKVKGIVFVSRELSLKKHFFKYNKQMVVIGNGIDLSKYVKIVPPKNLIPHIVFIGSSGQSWHGVDKLIWLASNFTKWRFDIIGIKESEFNNSIPSNMVFHGFLKSSEYEPIMAKADVAIGTLALHRKNLEEASPLKVREYLAYGIPTIIAYKDTDFSRKIPYILQLPNSINNVKDNKRKICNFVTKIKGSRVPRNYIYHIDTKYKERKRLDFFYSLIRKEI